MSEADQSVGGAPSTVPVGHDGVRVEIDERTVTMRNGWAALGGATLLLALSAGAFIGIGLVDPVALKALLAVIGSILSIVSVLVYSALTIVNLIWFVFKCLVLMLLSLTLVKSATGRFRIDQAFRFYVKVPTVLALVSLVLVWAL